MQFGVAVVEFLRFCALERQLSGHSVQAYAADLRDFRKWLKADVAIGDVSLASLKEYLEDMVGSRKLTVATVRRRFACLRAFFRRACERHDCPDPFANWRPLLPRRKRLPRTLSRGEAAFLLSARHIGIGSADDSEHVFRIVVQLMVATGMRVGELCKLKLDDLSPDCSVVRIHGKGARDRVAYITDRELRKELQQLIAHRRNSVIASGALFVNRYGAQMRPQSVRSKLRRLAQDAGLARRVTPHMLRHTAATLLIETGVDIRFVQRLLGHSSIATTEIYTHVSDEALRATLERADVLGTLSSR
jgi:site-specific recombinase XerD